MIKTATIAALALALSAVMACAADLEWKGNEQQRVEAMIRNAYLDRNELVSQVALVKTGDRSAMGLVVFADWTGKDMVSTCETHDGGPVVKVTLTCGDGKPVQ